MTAPTLVPWDAAWSATAWDTALNKRFEQLEFDVILPRRLTAMENLSLDEALLYRVASGARRPLFRMWDWSEAAIIIGSYQAVSDEIDQANALRHGFGFARRISGGGAMVVEAERSITWSMIVPETLVADMSFVQSFAFLDAWCVRALRSLGVPASYRPVNDIVSPSGKIAGAAQCRRRGTVLHHATMAWELDSGLMRGLLRHGLPRTNPKGIPSAEKHVTPLSGFTTLSRTAVMEYLVQAFRGLYKTRTSDYTPEDHSAAAARSVRLRSHDWLYRVP